VPERTWIRNWILSDGQADGRRVRASARADQEGSALALAGAAGARLPAARNSFAPPLDQVEVALLSYRCHSPSLVLDAYDADLPDRRRIGSLG
jgi:hypothetical protein